jgi:hypothetical protein
VGAWAGWQAAVLAALGAPDNIATRKLLTDWQPYEGGTAAFNPLNTTQPEPGATNYNSVGVKNYTSAAQGAQATATTLENGNYPALLAALRSGDPFTWPDAQGVAANITTWGTPRYAAAYLLAAGSVGGAPGAIVTPPVPSSGAGSSGPFAPSAHGGWHAINVALSRTIPHRLDQGARVRRQAERNLAKKFGRH